MKTALLLDERRNIAEGRFVELLVWQVPQPVRASTHLFKYRLAFVVDGMCVLRYDNEAARAITGTSARWNRPTPSPRRNSFTPISWQT